MLALRIDGDPAPQGSKSGFVNPSTGKVRMVEKSKRLKPWRATVAAAVRDALDGAPPLDGPIEVDLVFYLPRGKTVRRLLPTVTPDIDKLTRAVLDGLGAKHGGGAIADDARVVDLHVRKRYADDCAPGVVIKVQPALGAEAVASLVGR